MHSSISALVDYLEKNQFKSENLVIALTFSDGMTPQAIQMNIEEMKEHPLVGKLFQMAGHIIPTALPVLKNLEEDFKVAFTNRRKRTITTYLELFSKEVDYIPLITHELFEESLKKAREGFDSKTKSDLNEKEELISKLSIDLAQAQDESTKQKDVLQEKEKELDEERKRSSETAASLSKVVILEHEKQKISDKLDKLKQTKNNLRDELKRKEEEIKKLKPFCIVS